MKEVIMNIYFVLIGFLDKDLGLCEGKHMVNIYLNNRCTDIQLSILITGLLIFLVIVYLSQIYNTIIPFNRLNLNST
jgi:hypothetical protein